MRFLLTTPVRIYQIFSSLSAPACKFYPSCSTYAMTAVKRYGLKGVGMTLHRLGRCHPWSHGGLDYVDADLDSADALRAKKNQILQNQVEKEVVGAK